MLREDLEKIIGHFYGDEYDSCCDKLVNKDRKCSCDTEWKVDQIITLIEKAIVSERERTDQDTDEFGRGFIKGCNQTVDQILNNLGLTGKDVKE